MKKIITLISVLLICITTFGQFPQNPTQGQTQIKQTNLGAIEAQRGLKAGQFVDTSAANAVLYMKGVAGILIYTTSDNNYWYRSADTTRWVLIATTTSNCAGTQLISGSITWSGSGLVYDATDLDYYILCSRYFANSTTLTLAVADPTYPRIDKFYADITGAIGVITGTPATNPQEPQVNMLNQIDLGFVYIPAGSTVPAGTTQTVIYNENVEWTGTSDVPSVNFDYATNPYIGTVSTYLPNAPNSSYVEWQSNGIDYLFSDAQYLKFWVRLNANFVSDPLSFLDVTFEYTDVTVSQTLSVGNGDYNMDYSLINQWQLVSIPLTGITTFGTEFNSVHFVINSAPTSFQLDYIYLLETATIPPAPVGGTWLLNGNSAINDATQYIGTRDAKKLNFGTNGQIRAYIDTAGIDLLIDDTTANVMLIDSNGKIWKTYQPTILADSPLVIYTDVYQRHIKADTTRRGAALATQYYADSVANAGGGGWSLLGNAGTTAGTNFIGTTDAGVGFMIKTEGVQSGYIDVINGNTSFGQYSLNSNTTGNGNTAIGGALFNNTSGSENIAIGGGAMRDNTIGNANTAIGNNALLEAAEGYYNIGIGVSALQENITGIGNVGIGDTSLITNTTGKNNTAVGRLTDVATSSTDSAVAIGYQAVASTKQVAFSPHLTTMFLDLDTASGTAPAIAGIDANGNWRKYATPSVGGGTPAGNYGNIQINRNGAFDTPGGDSLSFSESSESLNVIGGIHVSDAVGTETGVQSYIRTTNDLFLGDVTNGVYVQVGGSNTDNILKLYSTGGNPMELHDDVTVIGNITAHNIIGATATQTDANFSATAGTAYVLSGNNSATRTITMPTLAEGDVFEFYNENTSANKWVSSATIYLSDNTTFTTLADDTNYILRYVGGKLRVSN
jgi:hypothetical protein